MGTKQLSLLQQLITLDQEYRKEELEGTIDPKKGKPDKRLRWLEIIPSNKAAASRLIELGFAEEVHNITLPNHQMWIELKDFTE